MKTYVITDIKAREIVDNRGMPTIRVEVHANDEFTGRADVECGSSTGTYEAFELRDGGSRYNGKGVKKAINNIHKTILPKLRGMDVKKQREIDGTMITLDGTKNKSEPLRSRLS